MNKNKVIAIVVTTAAIIYALWKVVGPDLKYNAAVAMMNEGKYEKAMAAFDALDGYKDSYKQKSECQTAINDKAYDEAVTLMNEGKYEEALSAFYALHGYKDSTKKARSIREKLNFEQMKAAEAGEYITFGTYNKVGVEWLVLERDGNRLFVISKYVLDRQLYNDEIESVTWETCTLRKWLNRTFLNEAFSKSEQSLIQTTEVSADKNPYWKTNPGEATNDKMFLLSINEVNKYFTSDEERICAPTRDASVGNKDASSWWLRSPGIYQQVAARVKEDGSVSSDEGVVLMGDKYGVVYYPEGVRPAMWIDLDA